MLYTVTVHVIYCHKYILLCREQYDTVFELLNMCLNIGLWYTKHASKIASIDE